MSNHPQASPPVRRKKDQWLSSADIGRAMGEPSERVTPDPSFPREGSPDEGPLSDRRSNSAPSRPSERQRQCGDPCDGACEGGPALLPDPAALRPLLLSSAMSVPA
jgi:hypothetical protein